MVCDVEEEAIPLPPTRVGHIKKRALKNKSLSVAFNEKDLREYVTGFHKRKKKRRKLAQKQQEEALRLKRIELRKKRKLEKELALYGGATPATDEASQESDKDHEDNGESGPSASIRGTTTYDHGEIRVTVTTREISREDEDVPTEKIQAAVPTSIGADKRRNLAVSQKKSFKKASKHVSRPKPQNKRNKSKGTKRNKKG